MKMKIEISKNKNKKQLNESSPKYSPKIPGQNFPWKDFWRMKAPKKVLLTVWKIFDGDLYV